MTRAFVVRLDAFGVRREAQLIEAFDDRRVVDEAASHVRDLVRTATVAAEND